MKGIELNRAFFLEYGVSALDAAVGDWRDCCTVGVAGGGSECFGYDDAISADHDFMPGFCIWLDRADEVERGFRLMRAYSRLPKQYGGIKREQASALACRRYGVMITEDFFERLIGSPGAPADWRQWFYTPQQALAEASNGALFHEGGGSFLKTRATLRAGFPRDVLLKKLSGDLALAAQAGQYNFSRCIEHGEPGAAALAAAEYVSHLSRALINLSGRYAPYYKWRMRALRECHRSAAALLEQLLLSGADSDLQKRLIEQTADYAVSQLRSQGLSESRSDYLEQHAFSVQAGITSREIASLHIMECGG